MNGQVKALLVVSVLVASVILGVTLANAVVPTVTVEEATNVSYTTADVEGEVDPQGQSTSWKFQYATEADFSDAQDGPAGTTETPEAVSGTLTGLTPGQTYHLRLLAENADGPSEAIAASTFKTKEVAKPTTTIEAPSLLNAAAERYYFSGHVNPGGSDPAFDTEWRFDCSPGCEVANGNGTVPADEESHLLEAEVEGLQPLTTYTVTLHAKNLGGEVTASKTFKTTAAPPLPVSAPNTPEPGGQATIRGYLNPRGSTVSNCHFEYGPGEGYGQSAPCEAEDGEPLTIGTGNAPVPVSAHLSGLTPGATYHYRLVAIGAAGTGSSPDQFFEADEEPSEPSCANEARRAEQHSTALPDCRAYEMVSPVDKNGGEVMSDGSHIQAAPDGNRAAFASLQGFGDIAGYAVVAEYLADRTGTGPTGWTTHSIFPPQPDSSPALDASNLNAHYEADFSTDLDSGIFRATSPLTDAPMVAEVQNLYLRADLDQPGLGSYQLITDCPQCTEPISASLEGFSLYQFLAPHLLDATPDLGRILFSSPVALLPGTFEFLPSLYEWDHGTLRLISLGSSSGAISDDGRREFFTDLEGKLIMRDTATEETVQLNESEASSPGEPQPAGFAGASSDGSRVFFTSSAALVNDACGGCENLYMYDASKPAADSHNLTLVNLSTVATELRGISNVFGSSSDGRTVYFIGNGQLVAGQPLLVGSGHSGLFAWHDGTLTYVSPLPFTAGADTVARVTPSGDILFSIRTTVGPTGYHQGTCIQAAAEPCRELYLYTATTDSLRCVTCNPSSEPGDGNAGFETQAGLGAGNPKARSTLPFTADGRHVFFDTTDSLTPADTNGTSDVYQYDVASGALHLISTGTDPEPSYFGQVTPDGSDVFFTTRQPLLGWDPDHAYDLYDARAGGGFPEPPSVTAPCNGGDTCMGAQPTPPAPAPVGSGAERRGNSKPVGPRCPKGKVRGSAARGSETAGGYERDRAKRDPLKKHGKCIKKPSNKHSAKKHHGRRATNKQGGGK